MESLSDFHFMPEELLGAHVAPELRPDFDRFDVLGLVVAKHRVLRVIGSGGWGTVYEGEHVQLGECRALKLCRVLDTEPIFELRAINEAKIGAMLRHPSIGIVHDFDVTPDGKTPVIVMELLRGHSLWAAWRKRGQRLPWQELFRVLSSVCDGLAVVHERGVVHRDIKLENIFLTATGPKLMDFGISKLPTSRATKSGMHVGTPHYMAPEQIRNAKTVDGRADLYSVGAVLYRGLTGQCLFPDLYPLPMVQAILDQQPAPVRQLLPSLPLHAAVVVERCLLKDPARRYQSAHDLKLALEASLQAGEGMLRARPFDQTINVPSKIIPPPRPQGAAPLDRMSTMKAGAVQLSYMWPWKAEQGAPMMRMMTTMKPVAFRLSQPPRRHNSDFKIVWPGDPNYNK